MGLDSAIYVKIKFKSGFELEREVCYWRKHWSLRNRIINNVLGGEKIGMAYYPINKGDLIEIRDILIDACDDVGNIVEYDYFGNPNKFVETNYHYIGEIQKLLLLIKDSMFIYDYLTDEEYKRAVTILDDETEVIEIEKIEFLFLDSY